MVHVRFVRVMLGYMTTSMEQTVFPPQTDSRLDAVLEVLTSAGPIELVTAEGRRARIPEELVEVIQSMVTALHDGQAITLAPHSMKMTTQDAADFLGISRPTVVRLLERGEIPYAQPGRHRRILLADLLEYQQESAMKRRRILDSISRQAEEEGLSGGGFVATR